jgi:hypothetical protein
MMLIATTVAGALSASMAGAPAPAASSVIPPMIVHVSATPDIPATVIAGSLAEADKIWRANGITFIWRRVAQVVAPSAGAGDAVPYLPNALRVLIGANRGNVRREGRLPLGWIQFDAVAAPQQDIYLSYANALQLMVEARPVVGIVEQMTIAERDRLLARAMGRALAHELGHYLLASQEHTRRGLMKAVLTAVELFSFENGRFSLEPAQRRALVARLNAEPLVASR